MNTLLNLENWKTGPLVPRRQGPRSSTKCSASLWYSNLLDIFIQLECKHLNGSDIRQPASPTVKVKVCDKNSTQLLSVLTSQTEDPCVT